MRKLLFIGLALFALARIQEKEAGKVDTAACYVGAHCGQGTDIEIADAIGKARKVYGLTEEETEELAVMFYN
jgi:hypothetical protein